MIGTRAELRYLAHLACVGIIACGPPLPSDLGEAPGDDAKLKDSPVLGYLLSALDADEALTVADLFAMDPILFETAPDPTDLFAARHEAARYQTPASQSQALSVLTYNVGLLDRAKYFGIFDRVRVPEIEARREALPDLVCGRGDDIVLLQELWEEADRQAFADAAERHGYKIYGGSEDNRAAHGLAILVRSALLDKDAGQEVEEHFYERQYDLEFFPGPGLKRAYLSWRFTTDRGVPVRVFDTHLTAMPEHWRVRMEQARELGLAAAGAAEKEVVLVGGDFNSGPYYEHDGWFLADGTELTGWWDNAIAYPLLLHYGGLHDLLVAARTALDVVYGRQVPNNWERALEVPFGQEGYCDHTPHLVFTATDCNSLYFRNYAGTEFPARIDHLFYRAGGRQVDSISVDLVFTGKQRFGDAGSFEPSDHYGVAADLRVEVR